MEDNQSAIEAASILVNMTPAENKKRSQLNIQTLTAKTKNNFLHRTEAMQISSTVPQHNKTNPQNPTRNITCYENNNNIAKGPKNPINMTFSPGSFFTNDVNPYNNPIGGFILPSANSTPIKSNFNNLNSKVSKIPLGNTSQATGNESITSINPSACTHQNQLNNYPARLHTQQTNNKVTVAPVSLPFQNNPNASGTSVILQTPQKTGYNQSTVDQLSISPWLFHSPGTASMYSIPQSVNNNLPFKLMTPNGNFHPRFNPNFSGGNNNSSNQPYFPTPTHPSSGLTPFQNWQGRRGSEASTASCSTSHSDSIHGSGSKSYAYRQVYASVPSSRKKLNFSGGMSIPTSSPSIRKQSCEAENLTQSGKSNYIHTMTTQESMDSGRQSNISPNVPETIESNQNISQVSEHNTDNFAVHDKVNNKSNNRSIKPNKDKMKPLVTNSNLPAPTSVPTAKMLALNGNSDNIQLDSKFQSSTEKKNQQKFCAKICSPADKMNIIGDKYGVTDERYCDVLPPTLHMSPATQNHTSIDLSDTLSLSHEQRMTDPLYHFHFNPYHSMKANYDETTEQRITTGGNLRYPFTSQKFDPTSAAALATCPLEKNTNVFSSSDRVVNGICTSQKKNTTPNASLINEGLTKFNKEHKQKLEIREGQDTYEKIQEEKDSLHGIKKSKDPYGYTSFPQVRCSCKKTRCLKLYCDCFQNGIYCKDDCKCSDCSNNPSNELERQKAIKLISIRRPTSFKALVNRNVVQRIKTNGCHCKRSSCKKKYCECFEAGILCGDACKCIDCENCDPPKKSNNNVDKTENNSTQNPEEEKELFTSRKRLASDAGMNSICNADENEAVKENKNNLEKKIVRNCENAFKRARVDATSKSPIFVNDSMRTSIEPQNNGETKESKIDSFTELERKKFNVSALLNDQSDKVQTGNLDNQDFNDKNKDVNEQQTLKINQDKAIASGIVQGVEDYLLIGSETKQHSASPNHNMTPNGSQIVRGKMAAPRKARMRDEIRRDKSEDQGKDAVRSDVRLDFQKNGEFESCKTSEESRPIKIITNINKSNNDQKQIHIIDLGHMHNISKTPLNVRLQDALTSSLASKSNETKTSNSTELAGLNSHSSNNECEKEVYEQSVRYSTPKLCSTHSVGHIKPTSKTENKDVANIPETHQAIVSRSFKVGQTISMRSNRKQRTALSQENKTGGSISNSATLEERRRIFSGLDTTITSFDMRPRARIRFSFGKQTK